MRTNAKKKKNNSLVYTLSILLVVAIGIALYYYVLKPEMALYDSLNQKYAEQQKYLTQLSTEQSQAKKEVERARTIKSLETKIPANTDLQSIVDSLDEVEYASSAAVTNIRFNNYEENSKEENDEKTTSLTEAELFQADESELPISPLADQKKPEQLKLVTMDLSVSAYDVKDLNRFINKLEKLPRLFIVDAVKYENTNEKEGLVTAKIQVTTFHVETKNKKETTQVANKQKTTSK